MGTFYNSFRKGEVVCRGLDISLSGKVEKKRLWHGKEVATPTMLSLHYIHYIQKYWQWQTAEECIPVQWLWNTEQN